jgi:pimeloyl-ACP methyl ester carboxylesterase
MTLTSGEPVYVASGTSVLVFLHEPDETPHQRNSILLCPSFGWQEQCAYRSLRAWATSLAVAGYPTARLTLPASGDSAGDPSEPDQLTRWTAAVEGTAGWLKERTGADRVVTIGIGLGGALAWLAACDGAAIDDLVLWAVPEKGRTMVRELQTQSALVSQQFPEDAHNDVDESDDLNLVGYRMSGDTRAQLTALRLTENAPARLTGRRVMLIGRSSLPVDRAMHEHVEKLGMEVEVAQGDDYDELMANPQQSLMPSATAAKVKAWLAAAPAETESGRRSSGMPAASERDTLTLDGANLIERPLRLQGLREENFAIVTQDLSSTPSPLAIVLVGAGALYHSGPNRAWVEIARRWAPRGVATVRLDLAGIGEADGDDPDLLTDASFYARWRADDTRGVMDQLSEMGIADRFILGGLCSGAYIALQAGLMDSRVRGLLLINMFAIQWSEALAAERGRRTAIANGLPVLRTRRKIDREFIEDAMKYVRPDRAWRLMRRSLEREEGKRAVAAFDHLRGADVETLMVLGQQEPLLEQFVRQGLMRELGRWPNLTLEQTPSRDHMFREFWLQRLVHDSIDRAIERVVASTGAGLALPTA